MQDSILYISELKVRQLLDWHDTFKAVETAMRMQYLGKVQQPPRTVTSISGGPTLYVMPGYLQDDKPGALACKLTTAADNSKADKPLPNLMSNIALFDDTTGQLLAIIAGTEITKWRTAAASVVATKLFLPKDSEVLALVGAGVQGEIHARAFQHFFTFKQVRIWNRNIIKAQILVDELNRKYKGGRFVVSNSVKECLCEADVIITTTNSSEPLVQLEWIKPGAHINAVGVANGQVHELGISVYKEAHLYIDTQEAALSEMELILAQGITFEGEIGGVIEGAIQKPENPRVTIFQSLGMAVEDCAMARLIYDRYMQTQSQ